MKSLTTMFNKHVGIPTMTAADIHEYLTEREGMRIDSGESEEHAVQEALKDLDRLQGIECTTAYSHTTLKGYRSD